MLARPLLAICRNAAGSPSLEGNCVGELDVGTQNSHLRLLLVAVWALQLIFLAPNQSDSMLSLPNPVFNLGFLILNEHYPIIQVPRKQEGKHLICQ